VHYTPFRDPWHFSEMATESLLVAFLESQLNRLLNSLSCWTSKLAVLGLF
ncbi:unnamed protein product, partial [Acidithrix sp. C25]